MIEYLGWAATAVFVGLVLLHPQPACSRAVQMVGALMWVVYGLFIGASPVVAANLAVFAAAGWTLARQRYARGASRAYVHLWLVPSASGLTAPRPGDAILRAYGCRDRSGGSNAQRRYGLVGLALLVSSAARPVPPAARRLLQDDEEVRLGEARHPGQDGAGGARAPRRTPRRNSRPRWSGSGRSSPSTAAR